MRKRRVCLASFVARCTALALLGAGPVLVSAKATSAADKKAVLHVAEQMPELASVETNTTKSQQPPHPIAVAPVVGNRSTVTKLTSTNQGWVAREAIGKQTPLRDPTMAPAPAEADQTPSVAETRPEQKSVAEESAQSDAVTLPEETGAVSDDAVEGAEEAAEDAIAAPGPISLKSLKPVPLMAAQSEPSLKAPQTAKPNNVSVESNGETLPVDPPKDDRDARTTLPVRRPTIALEEPADPEDAADREDAAGRGSPETGSPARRPAVPSDDAPDIETPPSARQVAPVISKSVARLQRPIEQCLGYYYRRPENAARRSAWGLMHSIMVYGVDTPVISGRKRYNAIAWLAGNNICRGKRLLTVDRQGIAPRQGVGLQGHQGQLLAILGLVGVPKDYPLHVDRRKFTIDDLIVHEQRECRSGAELTFTLIALAHYIDTDSEWRSKDGEHWDFERLLQEELAQPVVGAACGGTHRLMGLSHALRIRKEAGLPINGQWARADVFIRDFTAYAWKLQNRDGSMSTNWFEGRGDNGNIDRKIQTTGHIVEWMLSHMPDDQLEDERLVRAVQFLTAAMSNNAAREKEIGPKGHALRSLAVYHQRVFGTPRPWDDDRTSGGSRATARRSSASHR